jgi:hypothetical protein
LLLTQEEFLQGIGPYTRSALQTIYNQPQSQEIECPPAYIFVLSRAVQSSHALSTFLEGIPEAQRGEVQSILTEYIEQQSEL